MDYRERDYYLIRVDYWYYDQVHKDLQKLLFYNVVERKK